MDYFIKRLYNCDIGKAKKAAPFCTFLLFLVGIFKYFKKFIFENSQKNPFGLLNTNNFIRQLILYQTIFKTSGYLLTELGTKFCLLCQRRYFSRTELLRRVSRMALAQPCTLHVKISWKRNYNIFGDTRSCAFVLFAWPHIFLIKPFFLHKQKFKANI